LIMVGGRMVFYRGRPSCHGEKEKVGPDWIAIKSLVKAREREKRGLYLEVDGEVYDEEKGL